MPMCASICVLPSQVVSMPQSHRARPTPQVILPWRLCEASFRTEVGSKPFSLKCFPHFILKPLTLLTTVTHSGAAHYLPCPITPPVNPKRKYITYFLLITNIHSNSRNEVVPWVCKLTSLYCWQISSFSFLYSGTLYTLLLLTRVHDCLGFCRLFS